MRLIRDEQCGESAAELRIATRDESPASIPEWKGCVHAVRFEARDPCERKTEVERTSGEAKCMN